MAYIRLKCGTDIEVETADLELLMGYKWRLQTGYAVAWSGDTTILMHRLIAGAPAGMEVDHKDGNRANNLRTNLRCVTHADNMKNRPLHKNNVSGRAGVSWKMKKSRWYAYIQLGGRTIGLGTYRDYSDAVAARDLGEAKYFGQFARRR